MTLYSDRNNGLTSGPVFPNLYWYLWFEVPPKSICPNSFVRDYHWISAYNPSRLIGHAEYK